MVNQIVFTEAGRKPPDMHVHLIQIHSCAQKLSLHVSTASQSLSCIQRSTHLSPTRLFIRLEPCGARYVPRYIRIIFVRYQLTVPQLDHSVWARALRSWVTRSVVLRPCVADGFTRSTLSRRSLGRRRRGVLAGASGALGQPLSSVVPCLRIFSSRKKATVVRMIRSVLLAAVGVYSPASPRMVVGLSAGWLILCSGSATRFPISSGRRMLGAGGEFTFARRGP